METTLEWVPVEAEEGARDKGFGGVVNPGVIRGGVVIPAAGRSVGRNDDDEAIGALTVSIVVKETSSASVRAGKNKHSVD